MLGNAGVNAGAGLCTYGAAAAACRVFFFAHFLTLKSSPRSRSPLSESHSYSSISLDSSEDKETDGKLEEKEECLIKEPGETGQ